MLTLSLWWTIITHRTSSTSLSLLTLMFVVQAFPIRIFVIKGLGQQGQGQDQCREVRLRTNLEMGVMMIAPFWLRFGHLRMTLTKVNSHQRVIWTVVGTRWMCRTVCFCPNLSGWQVSSRFLLGVQQMCLSVELILSLVFSVRLAAMTSWSCFRRRRLERRIFLLPLRHFRHPAVEIDLVLDRDVVIVTHVVTRGHHPPLTNRFLRLSDPVLQPNHLHHHLEVMIDDEVEVAHHHLIDENITVALEVTHELDLDLVRPVENIDIRHHHPPPDRDLGHIDDHNHDHTLVIDLLHRHHYRCPIISHPPTSQLRVVKWRNFYEVSMYTSIHSFDNRNHQKTRMNRSRLVISVTVSHSTLRHQNRLALSKNHSIGSKLCYRLCYQYRCD